jgi:hypothetical protein
VSIVVPNLNNDMHDGSVSTGDTWLHNNLDAYVQWATTHNSLLIVTFDEDDGSEANQIPTLFVGSMVGHGQYNETIKHFNVLRTVEDMFDLPYAGASSAAAAITDVWQADSGTFNQQGSVLTVTGTGAQDLITLSFDPNDGTQFSVSVNDVSNHYSTSEVTQVNLQAGAGDDEVIVSDPVNVDSAALSPHSSLISRTGFQVEVTGATTIYVYGNSKSTAQLFDAPTGAFVSTTTYSYTSGSGYFDMAANFGSLYGYAGGMGDVASLYSQAGDSFVATATYAYTADPVHQQFFNAAVGFHNLYAYGSSAGTDTASFYSAAGNWFVVSSAYSYLTDPTNHSFFDLANGFRTVYAYASSERTDVAFFYAGANSSFVSGPTQSSFSMGGTLTASSGFTATYAYATAGAGATADLFDSAGDDSVVASGETATLYTSLGAFDSLSGFDAVTAHQSTGNDTEHLDAVFFRYGKIGTWRDV